MPYRSRHFPYLAGTAVMVSLLTLPAPTAQASDSGSAEAARAMLERAVAALRADEELALWQFSHERNGFRDRDLYPFCADLDGEYTAHPALAAWRQQNLNDLKDKAGKPVGRELLGTAKEGVIAEVSYSWPRPGTDIPVAKAIYVTRVGDQVCGVRFYK